MKRQTTYIIVIDICSLRLKSGLRRKSSLQIDILDLEQMAADTFWRRCPAAAWEVLEAIENFA
jgi:hypothetical protein